MNPALIFHKVKLNERASPFSTALEEGRSVLVLGQSGAGIESLFELLSRQNEPHAGSLFWRQEPFSVYQLSFGRSSVQSLLGTIGGPVPDALAVAGLDGARLKSVSSLNPVQLAQLELAGSLCSDARVLVLSASLDLLDPWRQADIARLTAAWRAEGRTVVRFSNRTSLCAEFDDVMIAGRGTVLFHDTADHLRRGTLPVTYEVVTGEPSAAIAITRPFQVDIHETQGGFIFQSPHGQEIAAQLLTHGYGQVHSVIERLPSWEETLFEVCRTTVAGVSRPVPSSLRS